MEFDEMANRIREVGQHGLLIKDHLNKIERLSTDPLREPFSTMQADALVRQKELEKEANDLVERYLKKVADLPTETADQILEKSSRLDQLEKALLQQ